MTDNSDVTSGDLYYLWRAANDLLPQAQNVFDGQIPVVHEVNGSADQETYGKCHPMWVLLASELEMAMFMTSGALEMTSSTINRALDAFAYVDGNHAKGLTEIGEEFELKRDGEKGTKLNGLPDGYDGPNYDPRFAEEITS